MAGTGTNLSVPSFIKASSPSGLHRLMLLNNLKSGNKYLYQNIQFVDGYWYAWFYKDINFVEAGKELVKDTVKAIKGQL